LQDMQPSRLQKRLSEIRDRKALKYLGDSVLAERPGDTAGQFRRPQPEPFPCVRTDAVHLFSYVEIREAGEIRWLSVVAVVADDGSPPAEASQKQAELDQDVASWLISGVSLVLDLVISREYQDSAIDVASLGEQAIDGDITVPEDLRPRQR